MMNSERRLTISNYGVYNGWCDDINDEIGKTIIWGQVFGGYGLAHLAVLHEKGQ